MDAAIDRLVALVPPPAAPVDEDGDWPVAEAALGLALPADFKALLRTYGVGVFDDVRLLTPFDTHPDGVFDLVESARVLIPWFEDLRAEVPEDFPFPLYPEPGGLLPWAKTGDGADLCWLTEGQPDSWPTAAWNIRGGGHRYDMIATELLYRYLSGQLHVELLRPAPAEPWFDPYRERWEVSVALAPSDVPYEVRLRILREHLAPTADRGSHEDALGRRQDQFKVVERDWLLTFHETGYAADWIQVAFPPEDNRDARALIRAAVQAMGSWMLSATRNAQPVWSAGEGDV